MCMYREGEIMLGFMFYFDCWKLQVEEFILLIDLIYNKVNQYSMYVSGLWVTLVKFMIFYYCISCWSTIEAINMGKEANFYWCLDVI